MNDQPVKAVLTAIALTLAACAHQVPKAPDWAREVQTAETREAHLRLARHYDEVAARMRADAEAEQRTLTAHMQRPYVNYERMIRLRAWSEALIRDYEDAARQSQAKADYHRQLAGEARQ